MTHSYNAIVRWRRNGAVFTDNLYSRAHDWEFDGGTIVPASSSPSIVRVPMSREEAVDPEEAYVAALSSCHMLFFLSFARKQGFIIDAYVDEALGEMSRDARGKMWVSRVTLHPALTISGEKRPSPTEIDGLHHQAHEECFIANSVKTEIVIAPPAPIFV